MSKRIPTHDLLTTPIITSDEAISLARAIVASHRAKPLLRRWVRNSVIWQLERAYPSWSYTHLADRASEILGIPISKRVCYWVLNCSTTGWTDIQS